VHAESGTTAFATFAEAVFGYTLDLVEDMVTKFGQLNGLPL
jgi:hypothetical protein